MIWKFDLMSHITSYCHWTITIPNFIFVQLSLKRPLNTVLNVIQAMLNESLEYIKMDQLHAHNWQEIMLQDI